MTEFHDLLASLAIAFVMTALAVVGVYSLVVDHRTFDKVYAECRDRGYIENRTTRINCAVPLPPAVKAP